MSTQFSYRALLIAPDARRAGLNAFIAARFGAGPDWLDVPLSATGAAPITHWACCFPLTHVQAATWGQRLTQNAGIPLPVNFGQMIVDERIAFMSQVAQNLRQSTGVIVHVWRSASRAVSPWLILASEGLQLVSLK